MAYTQVVQNGKLVDTSATSTAGVDSKAKSGDGLDKDAFLQLLVAEMKYQDPLEPTTNTDYIAQLATFSQLEATTNLENTVESQTANSLVGKEVIIAAKSKTGDVSYVHGKVDYVMYENDKTFLSVNDKLYTLDQLDTVVDEDYYNATSAANDFETVVGKLPTPTELLLQDEKAVVAARAMYDSMTEYQKGFVDDKYLKVLEKVEQRLAELKKVAN